MKNGNFKARRYDGNAGARRQRAWLRTFLAAATCETRSRHVCHPAHRERLLDPRVWQSHSRKNTHTFYPPAKR